MPHTEQQILELIINMPTITKEKKFSFKMGADPEFSIILQNKRIDAQATMTEILKGKKEFKSDNHSMGYDVGKFGNIGWDGASQTGEIRPNPAYKPEEIVNNIGGLFNAFGKYMSIFELSTLSQHASIGGHVHFEAKNDWSPQKQKSVHTQMVSFYMPILMSENKINLALSIRQGYGSMTDFRFENKGHDTEGNSVKTYEFRCPSAEWLTSPKISEAVLAYLGVVYNEIVNHPKNIKKCKEILLKSEKQTEAFQTLALQEYDLLNQALLKSIRKHIKTFSLYNIFKDEIDFILHPESVTKEKVKFNYDISLGWKLSNDHKVTKRELSSEKQFNEKMKGKDADTISRMLHIDYNDDAKVSEFVNALSLRAGAFNWKLSKQYFVFGLKKGIKDIIVKNFQGKYLNGAEQIETLSDLELVDRAFEKMARKYAETGSSPNLMTIDFKTGKTMSYRDNLILIGLPYEMRMNAKTKPFIDMIWKIENNQLKISEIPKNRMKDGPGEIEKAKAEREAISGEEIPQNAIVIARNSQSGERQQRAIHDIAIEQTNTRNIDIAGFIFYFFCRR